MYKINISSENLVQKLLEISKVEAVCLLDSCGVRHLDSHLLIAGIKPVEVLELNNTDSEKTLSLFNKILSNNFASFFTISYDFGLKLENIKPRKKELANFSETDIFLSVFDCLIIHDYDTDQTFLIGNEEKFSDIELLLSNSTKKLNLLFSNETKIKSNFSETEYILKVKEIQELIREGETYQTNLTRQFRSELPLDLTPQQIFWNLRTNHPSPFASIIKRNNDFVVSISPERFVKLENQNTDNYSDTTRIIKTSPIKGTRPRGNNPKDDLRLKNQLLTSEKDRAENTMIVDLLRNDIGKICEFGSVEVEKLCDLEEHPSLFHLVSTISGKLKPLTNYADLIRATFPCGSITGCPKIRTMQIIDSLETTNRGLSMGAIGYCINDFNEILPPNFSLPNFHTSVAIRTMVIRDQEAIFNVGGGIVIDSDPFDEYEESLVKARALLRAIGINNF